MKKLSSICAPPERRDRVQRWSCLCHERVRGFDQLLSNVRGHLRDGGFDLFIPAACLAYEPPLSQSMSRSP
jgi:hypothetical protein